MPDHQLPGQQSQPVQGQVQPQQYPPPGQYPQPQGWYAPPQPPPDYSGRRNPRRSGVEMAVLNIAWVGYGVLRGLKHPKPALSWFSVFVGGWLLVFLLWLGPEMAFPMSGSFFNRGEVR